MIRLLAVFSFIGFGVLIFRTLVRSRFFNNFCATWFGPDDDSLVIASLDSAEETARRMADEAEAISEKKRLNAESIRRRVRNPNS